MIWVRIAITLQVTSCSAGWNVFSPTGHCNAITAAMPVLPLLLWWWSPKNFGLHPVAGAVTILSDCLDNPASSLDGGQQEGGGGGPGCTMVKIQWRHCFAGWCVHLLLIRCCFFLYILRQTYFWLYVFLLVFIKLLFELSKTLEKRAYKNWAILQISEYSEAKKARKLGNW